MEQTLLILLLCSIIIIIILGVVLNKRNKVLEKTVIDKHKLEVLRKDEMKEYFKEEWEQEEKHLQNEIALHEKEVQLKHEKLESDFKVSETELNGILRQLESLLREKEKRYNEVNQDLEVYRQGKIKEIDSTAAEYEQRKRQIVDNSIDKYRNLEMDLANAILLNKKIEIDTAHKQIEILQNELESERSKRAAINEEILRQRKLEQEQDFFRIQLDPDDTEDIEILRSVITRLRHPEAINKVIWTGYYQKPLAELRKRILTNGDVSGVYKITRLKTNEIYIGQTTSVDGPENFTFELLEEVPKDKLRERESYYIDFYDSKTYGLNSVTGDKK